MIYKEQVKIVEINYCFAIKKIKKQPVLDTDIL